MNRMATVIGVAAIATLAGCKDPDYKHASTSSDEVKIVPSSETRQTPPPAPVVERPSCNCPVGMKHEVPCACGAPDCRCEVVKARPVPPPPPPEPEFTVYTVRSGDYLAKISKRYNVTISSIKRLNGLKSDKICVGQKLKIPGKVAIADLPPVAEKTAQKPVLKPLSTYTGETKEYVVKAGDTIGSIAYGHGCNIRQLKKLNGLASDTIREGQKLKVPASGKAAAKAEPAKKPAVAAKKQPQPAPEAKPDVEKKPVEETPAADTSSADGVDAAAPAEAPAEPARTYVVQEGEDMTAVCIRWNVSSSAIRELNNLPDDAQLTTGQVLKLPAEAHQ